MDQRVPHGTCPSTVRLSAVDALTSQGCIPDGQCCSSKEIVDLCRNCHGPSIVPPPPSLGRCLLCSACLPPGLPAVLPPAPLCLSPPPVVIRALASVPQRLRRHPLPRSALRPPRPCSGAARQSFGISKSGLGPTFFKRAFRQGLRFGSTQFCSLCLRGLMQHISLFAGRTPSTLYSAWESG